MIDALHFLANTQIFPRAMTDRLNGDCIFQESWWLSAATNADYCDVTVTKGNQCVGRLPFTSTRKYGQVILGMPPFTHILGPVVESRGLKVQTRLVNRLSVVRSLIDKLPRFDFFKYAIDPTLDDGLSLADGLVFQERGFHVMPQYTFEIDCRRRIEDLFDSLHFKVRQHIRRAEEKLTVKTIENPQEFIGFYRDNLKRKGNKVHFEFKNFTSLFFECVARKCGVILAACFPNGEPAAMTFLVWGRETMYYLLSTRAGLRNDSGSTNLLIWSAMKEANKLGVKFDLDGVSTAGTARFLSGFSGQIKTRLIITKSRPIYRVLRGLKSVIKTDVTANFT